MTDNHPSERIDDEISSLSSQFWSRPRRQAEVNETDNAKGHDNYAAEASPPREVLLPEFVSSTLDCVPCLDVSRWRGLPPIQCLDATLPQWLRDSPLYTKIVVLCCFVIISSAVLIIIVYSSVQTNSNKDAVIEIEPSENDNDFLDKINDLNSSPTSLPSLILTRSPTQTPLLHDVGSIATEAPFGNYPASVKLTTAPTWATDTPQPTPHPSSTPSHAEYFQELVYPTDILMVPTASPVDSTASRSSLAPTTFSPSSAPTRTRPSSAPTSLRSPSVPTRAPVAIRPRTLTLRPTAVELEMESEVDELPTTTSPESSSDKKSKSSSDKKSKTKVSKKKDKQSTSKSKDTKSSKTTR